MFCAIDRETLLYLVIKQRIVANLHETFGSSLEFAKRTLNAHLKFAFALPLAANFTISIGRRFGSPHI